MVQSQRLAAPAYLVCLALVLLPLSDVLTTLFPWQFSEARWRFGAVGLISNALLLPMAGLLIALFTATTLGHARVRVAIGIVSIVASLGCLLALVPFALDALQTRAAVRPEMQVSFNVASITAAAKTLFAATGFLLLALSSRQRKLSGATARSAHRPPLLPIDAEARSNAG